jgi:hypothetical protein
VNKKKFSRIAGTDAPPPEVVRVSATPFTEMMVETDVFASAQGHGGESLC